MFKIVPFLIRCKVYYDYTRMYYGYGQTPAFVLLLLRSYNVTVTAQWLYLYVPLFFIVSVVIGWLLLKFGFFTAEAARHSYLNPFNKEVLERLERIERDNVELLRKQHNYHCEDYEKQTTMAEDLKHLQAQQNATSDKIVRIIRLLQK